MAEDMLGDDIGRLYGKHGRRNVQQFFHKLNMNNKEIPPSSNSKRAMYNFARASYPKDVVLSPSFIRSDIKLGGDSSYTFPVLKSDIQAGVVSTKTSKLLDQNDTFEMTHLSFMMFTMTTTAGVANRPFQQCRFYTYPNPSVFAGAGESSALDGIYYGGSLLVEVGTDKVFPKLDLLHFLRVPTSQQGVAVSTAAAGVIPYDGFSSADYPWIDSVPGLTISGNGKYTFTVSLPEAATLSPLAAQNRDNYLTLYIRGILCSNGAKQQNKKFSPTY